MPARQCTGPTGMLVSRLMRLAEWWSSLIVSTMPSICESLKMSSSGKICRLRFSARRIDCRSCVGHSILRHASHSILSDRLAMSGSVFLGMLYLLARGSIPAWRPLPSRRSATSNLSFATRTPWKLPWKTPSFKVILGHLARLLRLNLGRIAVDFPVRIQRVPTEADALEATVVVFLVKRPGHGRGLDEGVVVEATMGKV